MSTEKKNEATDPMDPIIEAPQEQGLHLDPNMFGYEGETKAPFTANNIMALMGILNQIAMEGTTRVYTPSDSFQKTVESGKEQMSELAVQAVQAMELIMADHLDNADKGIAIHQDILQGKTKDKTTFEVAK